MRGKTVTMRLHRDAATTKRDDLGRRTPVADAGVKVRGSASPPSAVQRVDPTAGEACDVVAVIPADTPIDWTSPGVWVEIVSSRHSGVELGDYTIRRRSGGRRIIRLELVKMRRQDGTSGRA